MQLNIQLSAEECAAIVAVLGNLPYRQVAGLIHKIDAQADEQKRLAYDHPVSAAVETPE